MVQHTTPTPTSTPAESTLITAGTPGAKPEYPSVEAVQQNSVVHPEIRKFIAATGLNPDDSHVYRQAIEVRMDVQNLQNDPKSLQTLAAKHGVDCSPLFDLRSETQKITQQAAANISKLDTEQASLNDKDNGKGAKAVLFSTVGSVALGVAAHFGAQKTSLPDWAKKFGPAGLAIGALVIGGSLVRQQVMKPNLEKSKELNQKAHALNSAAETEIGRLQEAQREFLLDLASKELLTRVSKGESQETPVSGGHATKLQQRASSHVEQARLDAEQAATRQHARA